MEEAVIETPLGWAKIEGDLEGFEINFYTRPEASGNK